MDGLLLLYEVLSGIQDSMPRVQHLIDPFGWVRHGRDLFRSRLRMGTNAVVWVESMRITSAIASSFFLLRLPESLALLDHR